MNERVVVPSTGFRLASLTAPRTVEVVKPAPGQALTLDLGDKIATTLDFSAIADESLKFVHAGSSLIVEFDDRSMVTAEPFFDSSGKPLPYLEVELGGARPMNGEQFAALLSGTVGVPLLNDDDKIVSSGASFVAPSIDALPESLQPVAPLQQDGHRSLAASSSDGAGIGAPTPHSLLLDTTPVLNIPGPGGAATLVFEGGLAARSGEPAGSHAGSPSFPVTTRLGSIGFTAPDGLQSITLGGHLLSTSPQTFTDATGSLTASYTFDAVTHRGTISFAWPHSESLCVVYSDDACCFRSNRVIFVGLWFFAIVRRTRKFVANCAGEESE